ncbi:MAG: polysaccharide deacetylase family protein [Nitrospirae bacterium]|nr:polysaccharide deacetylase family protein [Nitrospirota bacterium]
MYNKLEKMSVKETLIYIYTKGFSFIGAFRHLKKLNPVILLYHNVCKDGVNDLGKFFELQMSYLKDNYRIISLEELVLKLQSVDCPVENLAAVTFDDGYMDNYDVAYPILRRMGIHATFFISSGFIDSADNKYMTWDMIREVADSGFITIGNHTHGHRVLKTLSKEAQAEEIRAGRQRLEDMLSIKITSFAYPYGKKRHYSADTVNIIREDGYAYAVSSFSKSMEIPNKCIYEIPRIPMDRARNMREFEARLSVLWSAVQSKLGRNK